MRRATHVIRSLGLAAAVAVTGLFMPGPVSAQQQANTSGRALDANPQVGAGGVNDLQGQIDFQIRNDVITGNVAGGREFRGDVGYRAPGEFRDTLGSDDLFRFRAQSLPSDPRRLDTVRTSQNYTAGGGTSIYRSYTSVPTVRPLTRPQRTDTNIAIEGYSVDDPRATIGGTLLGELGAPPAGQPQVLGLLQQPDGRLLELNASPLLGLRTDLRAERLGLDLPTVRALELAPDAEDAEEAQEQEMLDQSLRPTTRLDPLGFEEQAEARFAEPARIAPTLLLGQQLRSPVGAERADRADLITQQRLERLERRLFGRAEEAAPGEDPYRDLLRRVREGDRLMPAPAEDEAEDEDAEPRTLEQALEQLREPTDHEVEQAERVRQQAVEQAWPTQDQPAEDEGEGAQAPGQADAALAELMAQLDYNLPPLQTLAGQRQTRVDQMMQQAEQELASGQYFAAEGLYRQVLLDAPDQPLARVGLIHAQLGAGMIRSAALNLRRLFEQHPELIAARYGENLLPSADRLGWVQQELQRIINTGADTSSAPGLVMAYLGYQAGSRQLVRYGLASAEARDPRDPLLPVLRRIWLGEGQAADAAPAADPMSEEPAGK